MLPTGHGLCWLEVLSGFLLYNNGALRLYPAVRLRSEAGGLRMLGVNLRRAELSLIEIMHTKVKENTYFDINFLSAINGCSRALL